MGQEALLSSRELMPLNELQNCSSNWRPFAETGLHLLYLISRWSQEPGASCSASFSPFRGRPSRLSFGSFVTNSHLVVSSLHHLISKAGREVAAAKREAILHCMWFSSQSIRRSLLKDEGDGGIQRLLKKTISPGLPSGSSRSPAPHVPVCFRRSPESESLVTMITLQEAFWSGAAGKAWDSTRGDISRSVSVDHLYVHSAETGIRHRILSSL